MLTELSNWLICRQLKMNYVNFIPKLIEIQSESQFYKHKRLKMLYIHLFSAKNNMFIKICLKKLVKYSIIQKTKK